MSSYLFHRLGSQKILINALIVCLIDWGGLEDAFVSHQTQEYILNK